MKSLAVLTIMALGLSAPALAQSPDKPINAKPITAAQTAPASDATPLDEIVQDGSEDRAKLLLRCVGPPPKLLKEIAALAPASEPALIAGGGADSGG